MGRARNCCGGLPAAAARPRHQGHASRRVVARDLLVVLRARRAVVRPRSADARPVPVPRDGGHVQDLRRIGLHRAHPSGDDRDADRADAVAASALVGWLGDVAGSVAAGPLARVALLLPLRARGHTHRAVDRADGDRRLAVPRRWARPLAGIAGRRTGAGPGDQGVGVPDGSGAAAVPRRHAGAGIGGAARGHGHGAAGRCAHHRAVRVDPRGVLELDRTGAREVAVHDAAPRG